MGRANRPNYPAFVAPEHGQGSIIHLFLRRDTLFDRVLI